MWSHTFVDSLFITPHHLPVSKVSGSEILSLTDTVNLRQNYYLKGAFLVNPPGAPKAWLISLFFSSGSYLVRILQKPTPEIACSKNVNPRIEASGEVGGRLQALASSTPWGVWCEFGVPMFPWALGGAWENSQTQVASHRHVCLLFLRTGSPKGGFPSGASGKEPVCQCRRHKKLDFDPWVRKIPWRGAWQPTPVFSPGGCHGQRSYSPYSCRESDATEAAEHGMAGH